MFRYYRDLVLASRPSVYYPLDAQYGFGDLGPSKLNGTGQFGITAGAGSPPIRGSASGSTDFDYVNDYVTTAYSPFVNGVTRSFEGWANRDILTNSNVLIGSSGGTNVIQVLSGTPSLQFYVGGPQCEWSSVWPGVSVWVHWAVVFDEPTNAARAYINGADLGVAAQTSTWGADGGPGTFQIGGFQTGGNLWDGKQAHVAVYERALTLTEIRAHYKAGVW